MPEEKRDVSIASATGRWPRARSLNPTPGAAEYHGAQTQSPHGGTGSGRLAMILVSDTSVLIDLQRGGLLEPLFAVPHEIVVADVFITTRMQGDWGEGRKTWPSG
jgi:hypothetical protein